jgi:DNA mismatch repair protein MutS2
MIWRTRRGFAIFVCRGARTNEKVIAVLEFDQVLERLAGLTSFSAGREAAVALRPAATRAEAALRHARVAEARRLKRLRPNTGVGSAHDVRPLAEKARLSGVLEPRELLDLHDTLLAARSLRGNLTRLAPQFPLLAELAKRLADLTPVVVEIDRTITPRGEVADSASAALSALRREERTLHNRLQTRLHEILNSALASGVAQEPLITERNGRYVIPVKADVRGQLRGITHDVSSSGATLWVEPLAVVELGNGLREVQLEIEREVERVLRALSNRVGAVADQVVASVEGLAELDLVFASVRLGEALRAEDLPPDGTEQGWLLDAPAELRLVNARHPLLTGDVVPTTLYVGGAFSVLLITGPNTGGKTVALKTAGLLSLMALSGLPVPASEGSQVPVFAEIYADIGDEQSIAQSLSTFSSHMRNVIAILDAAGPQSLVLLDELGAGTDPEEGAALARAIVDKLLHLRATVIATTHHGELKVYAHETPGVTNASVEFNTETLAPTYRLAVGLPGRSNAIAIAARLGMPPDVLEQARAVAGPQREQVDDLLSALQQERDAIAAARRDEQARAAEADAIRRRLQDELDRIEETREEALVQARVEAESELAEARAALREARRRSAARVPEPAPEIAEAEREITAAAGAIQAARKRRPAPRRRLAAPSIPPEEVRAGDKVTVRGLPQQGEALGVPDERGELEVQLGTLRLRIRVDQIERIERSAPRVAAPVAATLPPRGPSPGLEIEVRGRRAEEAISEVEEYLDNAYRAGLPFVRIIHGKGTGALRRVVRETLSQNPLVSSFETAEPHAGGEGVTVARLAV